MVASLLTVQDQVRHPYGFTSRVYRHDEKRRRNSVAASHSAIVVVDFLAPRGAAGSRAVQFCAFPFNARLLWKEGRAGCCQPVIFQTRSTYFCIASSCDMPLSVAQASYLAVPTKSKNPGFSPPTSPSEPCL